MMFGDLISGGSIPALDAMLSFTEANHKVLAENIANIDTPGYQARHLDAGQFQRALATAVARKNEERSTGLRVESSEQVQQGMDGELTFSPTTEPAENVLFHDQTNARIEKQMSALAENAMMHQAAAQLLALNYQGMLKAIKGQM
jgi:flagellar basal-body rod protein FlgB